MKYLGWILGVIIALGALLTLAFLLLGLMLTPALSLAQGASLIVNAATILLMALCAWRLFRNRPAFLFYSGSVALSLFHALMHRGIISSAFPAMGFVVGVIGIVITVGMGALIWMVERSQDANADTLAT